MRDAKLTARQTASHQQFVKKMKGISILFLLVCVAWGCNRQPAGSQSTPTTVTASPTPGWFVYSNPGLGFRIAFPSSWKEIDLNPGKIEPSIQRLSKDPAVVESLVGYAQSRATSGTQFLAIDSGGLAMAQVVWKHADSKSPVNLDSLAETWTNNASSGGNELIGAPLHTHAAFPIGVAQEVRYATKESAIVQYLIGHESDIYILTFSTNPVNTTRYDSLFARIGRTMESSR